MAFRAIVLGAAALAVLGITRVRFCYDVTLPAKPPEPEPAEVSLRAVTEAVEANPIAYEGYLRDDSKTFGVSPPATPEQMSKSMAYRLDETRAELDPDDAASLEAAGLRLTLQVRNIEGQPRRMMVLVIENLTDQSMAYNVVTKPDHGTRICQSKPHLAHNAMAIPPRGRVERSECLYRRGWELEIRRVETLALPPLAYHYVSQLPPEAAGIEPRVSRGHRPPQGTTCNLILPATVARARDQGIITWRDLVDFYARHRCQTYRFPETYRAFSKDGEHPLPVMPEP